MAGSERRVEGERMNFEAATSMRGRSRICAD
jgi:hypothetical protein